MNDNNLQPGDVCVLEMTNHDTIISFKVIIFQATAEANSHPLEGVLKLIDSTLGANVSY